MGPCDEREGRDDVGGVKTRDRNKRATGRVDLGNTK